MKNIFNGGKVVDKIYYGNTKVNYVFNGEELIWCEDEPTSDIFRFVANTAGSTVKLTSVSGKINVHLEYSKNSINSWQTWDGNTITLSNVGDTLYIRASQDNSYGMRDSGTNYHSFVLTGGVSSYGNIQYLLTKDGSRMDVPTYAYYTLFNNCTSLNQAPELPATTLADSCYYKMFMGCTSLTETPDLPAETIAANCYSYMFSDCTTLTQAPAVLPAMTLYTYCYYRMFDGCTSLKATPELPSISLATYCYNNMFQDCSSLVSTTALPATTLQSYCYEDMFKRCTSLKYAPVLPATKLATYCYHYMFENCSSLKIRAGGSTGTQILYVEKGTSTPSNWNTSMFTGTGGSFTGSPQTGKTYYCYQ